MESLLEKWLYFIKHAEDLEVVPPHVAEPELQAAYQVADQANCSAEDLEAYEYRGIRIQEQRGALDFAHQLGREEGREEGEHNKAIETARRMKVKGYPLADTADLTGLTLSDLERL